MTRAVATTAIIAMLLISPAEARVWKDASGKYTFEADLIAFNETDLVLQKPDKTLVAVDMEQLSAEDQKYVQSTEAAEAVDKRGAKKQVWTMRSGLEVVGKVVDYVRKRCHLQHDPRQDLCERSAVRQPARAFNKRVVPLIAAHFTDRNITDKAGLFDWLKRRRGEPITFTVRRRTNGTGEWRSLRRAVFPVQRQSAGGLETGLG